MLKVKLTLTGGRLWVSVLPAVFLPACSEGVVTFPGSREGVFSLPDTEEGVLERAGCLAGGGEPPSALRFSPLPS